MDLLGGVLALFFQGSWQSQLQVSVARLWRPAPSFFGWLREADEETTHFGVPDFETDSGLGDFLEGLQVNKEDGSF